MDLDNINGFTLRGLAKINVILGKNGCGKSHLLKQLETGLTGRPSFGRIRYITPERGGVLQYDPNVERNMTQQPTWIGTTRRQNQTNNFRQQSATLFRRLELLVLREIERDHTAPGYVPRNFSDVIQKINTLLDRVRLERDSERAFKILERDTNNEASPEAISSGEAELISLGIEFLVFIKEAEAEKTNILLVDGPDVHLHPDLQDRLARFALEVLADTPVTVVLATHSTALLAGLSQTQGTHVAFMRRGNVALQFKGITDVDRAILPIFGSHPLSNVFNQAPALLIEGEDDERIWQQAVRSSLGRIRVFPCVVQSLTRFAEFESEVNNVIESVYDDARAYSLRDRDLHPEHIDDLGHVIRMRLTCRAAENLMLTDDVLRAAGTNWLAFQTKLREWSQQNLTHQYRPEIVSFIEEGFDRKNHDLKDIRNILIGLISNKPWEVLVGQSIAAITTMSHAEGSLSDFLGEKVCHHLLRLEI